MHLVYSLSLAATLAAADCAIPEAGLGDALGRIDAMLSEHLAAEEIPGLAAGIACGGELIWTKGYGVTSLEKPKPVTAATRFRIASITKLFTATAVMLLREREKLALADPVRRHLAWFELERPAETGVAPVTVGQVLTHTSGLPRDSSLTDFDRHFQPPRDAAVAALPGQRLEAAPGTVYAYSNLGYGVLGEVIAAASGSSYATFLEERIFAPLGMTETLVHPGASDDVAWGHGPRRLAGEREHAVFWKLGFATPAGGMASSVEDLGRFMILNLSPYNNASPRILSRDALRDMHEVHFMIDPDRGGMGLGWAVEISNGQHLAYHGGELPEQTSFMLLDLHARLGIVVLTNAQDVDANGMAQEMLRLLRHALPEGSGSFPEVALPPA